MDKLKSKLKEVPQKPGVYQFKNKDGEVIYVGKAKNLKSRIGQYLNGHDTREQIPFLLAEADDFDYTVVNNELESLFLENTVIKQYLPKYNIMLRDDKNYAFISIDYNSEIPKIGYARKIGKGEKNITYFGPFSAAYKIRNTLHLMRRIFPYCAADHVSSRPCFYYYLHRCPGVCIGKISLKDYRQYLNKIEDFLSGDTGKIKRELTTEMKLASSKQEFEKAARLRDQCEALELLEERQTVILPQAVSWDIISLALDQGFACINLFKVRDGKLQDKENFVFELVSETNKTKTSEPALVVQTFLEQYYLDTSSAPKVIYADRTPSDPELIEHIIRSRFARKATLSAPQKGKPAELVRLGRTNAEEYLKNWLSARAGHLDKINQSLSGLKDALGLSKIPERIECYDISNTQGTNAVGSMVVFKQGLPAKSEYRKFRIRYSPPAGGPDDFAMMKEMLSRRMARITNYQLPIPNEDPRSKTQDLRNSWPVPDLIVIDGGKGQLGMANAAISESGLNIPVIGLAKRIEEIFVPDQPEPIILSHDEPALQMLQRLRDEAHRFGITYHRDIRSKQAVRSALDDIPGLGPKTKKLLKTKFGTVASIRKASLDELAAVVGQKIAQNIKLHI